MQIRAIVSENNVADKIVLQIGAYSYPTLLLFSWHLMAMD